MPNRYRIIVLDASRLCAHHVVAQCLLERRCHKFISRSGSVQNGEVNLEPEQVDEERHQDESSQPCRKVLCEVGQSQSSTFPVDVQETPEVNRNRTTDREECKHSNVFGGYDTAHSDASKQEPFPPFLREGLVPHLEESDVAKNTERHCEYQSRIEQDKSSLANVGIIE